MNAINLKEIAKRLNCTTVHVYRMIKAGQLKARKLGRNTVVLEKDLNGFMDNLPDAIEIGAILADEQRAAA